jgi:carboxymethylenebutenolidase
VYNGDFAVLAMNESFMASHDAPLPLNYTPAKGSMVSFETLDAGKKGNAFYVPSDKPTTNVLLIFHEWWGLNEYIKREAERWQEMLGNVDVYAVDLYDGLATSDPVTAGKFSGGLDKKRAENIIKGILALAGRDKAIASLGWCMGGSWAFQASLLAGKQSVGTVMYYGFPEQEEKKIKTLTSDVLYIYATRDAHITRPVVDRFKAQVEETGNKFDLHTYDAVHAFANPSNPNHDALSSTQAELIAKKFLQEKMMLE